MMRKVVEKYPELIRCFRKEMGNKNKYSIKLFEAVGVATIHSQRIKKGDKSLKENKAVMALFF